MSKIFKNLNEGDVNIIQFICKLIEEDKIYFVANNKRYKILSRESERYTYDYTYNFCRWGFAKKARNTDFHAALHPYCPNQDMAATMARFINTAVEEGLYERTTDKKFDGGNNIQVIWM